MAFAEAAMNRKPLTDEQWAAISPLLATKSGRGGRPASNHRRTLNAILWILRTGSPWRDLSEGLGPWQTAYSAFRRWTRQGVWSRLLAKLAGERDCSLYIIDSTVVRAHQHAAGAQKSRSRSGTRPLARWLVDQDPCRRRCPWPPGRSPRHRWPGQRLHPGDHIARRQVRISSHRR